MLLCLFLFFLVAVLNAFYVSLRSFLRAFIVSVSFPRLGLLVFIRVLPIVFPVCILLILPSGCSLIGLRFFSFCSSLLKYFHPSSFFSFHRVIVVLSFVYGIFRARHNVLWSDLLVPCIFIDSALSTMLSLTNCSSSFSVAWITNPWRFCHVHSLSHV